MNFNLFLKNDISPIICFLTSFLLMGKLLPILRTYTLDKPNKRSSHLNPTPTGSGLIFTLSGSIICLFSNFFLFHCFAYPYHLLVL